MDEKISEPKENDKPDMIGATLYAIFAAIILGAVWGRSVFVSNMGCVWSWCK